MSDLLTSVGSFISSDAKPLTSLLSLAGAGTNLFSGIQQVQQQQQLEGAQKYVANLVQNPAKMNAAAAAYTQPLTAGLTEDITNQVQGNLAERGLGSTPAAFTQQLTQALAPYIQNNQQAGFGNLMSALGLTSGMKSFAPPFADLSKLLTQLKLSNSAPSGDDAASFSSLFGSSDPLMLDAPAPVSMAA